MNYTRNTDINVVMSNMVEIDFVDGDEQGFPKVKETLERIGIASNRTQTLYQSVHILHKQGRYYICHFMELFAADGRVVNLSEEDIARRNFIVKLLKDWNLITPISDNWKVPMGVPRMVKIVKHSDRHLWTFEKKYNIGTMKD